MTWRWPPRRGRMLTLCYQLIWKTPSAELFVLRAWKRPGLHAHSLQRFARPNGSPVTRGSGSDVTMAGLWTARQGADGKVHGPCKLCSCLDWSLPSPSPTSWLHGRSRGLACRMTWPSLGLLLRSTAPGVPLKARWPTQVTDSVAIQVEYGRLELNSLRTQSCRWRFGICVWRSHASDLV